MALEMRAACEMCKKATPPDAEAYICSYECTFCPSCAEKRAGVCPNCGGDLAPRPRRRSG